MGHHLTAFQGNVIDTVRMAIELTIPGAEVLVEGGGGHYTIAVTSTTFAGMSRLESQRVVYGAITHLMEGDAPPVHAVDRLTTRVP